MKKNRHSPINNQQSLADCSHQLSVVYQLIFVFIFLFFCLSSFSQKISATVDRDKILIGEQVELLVKVSGIEKNTPDISQWVALPDTFHHLEIVKRFPIDTITVEGSTIFAQKILITSFDSGTWQVPPIHVLFTDKQSITTVKPVAITVLPANISNLKDYHDIKEIIEVTPVTNWQEIAEIAAGVILLLIILFLLFHYFGRKKPKLTQSNKKFSVEDILVQLDALGEKGWIENHQYKLFFTGLITICRNFSDSQLQMRSTSKTTDEYMLLIKGKIGTEPAQIKYFQLLRLADAVKFAKFTPLHDECFEAIKTAKIIVQTIYQFQQKS